MEKSMEEKKYRERIDSMIETLQGAVDGENSETYGILKILLGDFPMTQAEVNAKESEARGWLEELTMKLQSMITRTDITRKYLSQVSEAIRVKNDRD